MTRTAKEIEGRIDDELEDAATAEAQRAAEETERQRGFAGRGNAREKDGLEEWRSGGFVGDAMLHGPGVRYVSPWEKVLAGWTWERVAKEAGLENFPEAERAFAVEAARRTWAEAKVRVALREYMMAESRVFVESAWHKGGERKACKITAEKIKDAVGNHCAAVFREELKAWKDTFDKTKSDKPTRGRNEVTQEEAAKELGVDVRTLRKWEAGGATPRNAAGYTKEKRRTRAGFAAFLIGLRRDLSTEENLTANVGGLQLGNRMGMGTRKRP